MKKKIPQAFQVNIWLSSINISSTIILIALVISLPVQCPTNGQLETNETQISLSSGLSRITPMRVMLINFKLETQILKISESEGPQQLSSSTLLLKLFF